MILCQPYRWHLDTINSILVFDRPAQARRYCGSEPRIVNRDTRMMTYVADSTVTHTFPTAHFLRASLYSSFYGFSFPSLADQGDHLVTLV